MFWRNYVVFCGSRTVELQLFWWSLIAEGGTPQFPSRKRMKKGWTGRQMSPRFTSHISQLSALLAVFCLLARMGFENLENEVGCLVTL